MSSVTIQGKPQFMCGGCGHIGPLEEIVKIGTKFRCAECAERLGIKQEVKTA